MQRFVREKALFRRPPPSIDSRRGGVFEFDKGRRQIANSHLLVLTLLTGEEEEEEGAGTQQQREKETQNISSVGRCLGKVI